MEAGRRGSFDCVGILFAGVELSGALFVDVLTGAKF